LVKPGGAKLALKPGKHWVVLKLLLKGSFGFFISGVVVVIVGWFWYLPLGAFRYHK
jgi:hypothetical protein